VSELLELVAWRGVRGFGKLHIARRDYPYSLFCGALVPGRARITRRDFERNRQVCKSCLKELDRLGVMTPRLVPSNGYTERP
jgi:hypothetical protein